MARLTIIRTVWESGATISQEADLGDHVIIGAQVTVPPATAFGEHASGLIAWTRPRDQNVDGLRWPPAVVGDDLAPHVLRIDPQRPRVYETPTWVRLLNLAAFQVVGIDDQPLGARDRYEICWICEPG